MTAPEVTAAIERADAAVRQAWGGRHHTTEVRFTFYAPPVRPGGATDALIRLAVPTALAAALDRQEIARALYEHHVADVEWRDGVTLCDWADVEQTTGETYLEQADGVIATVLGAGGDGAPEPWAARLTTTEEPPRARHMRATAGQRVTRSAEGWWWECDHAHEGDTDWCGTRATQDAAYTALDQHNATHHPHLTEEARRG